MGGLKTQPQTEQVRKKILKCCNYLENIYQTIEVMADLPVWLADWQSGLAPTHITYVNLDFLVVWPSKLERE